jgi:hypothetical protein
LNSFLVVFRIVILDKVIELVDVCAVARATVGSLVGYLLVIVREYPGEIRTFVATFLIAVAPFKAFEFSLRDSESTEHSAWARESRRT